MTGKLDDLASSAASSLDNAALTLADVGAGVVSSVFYRRLAGAGSA